LLQIGRTLIQPSKEAAIAGIKGVESAAGIGLKEVPENLPASPDKLVNLLIKSIKSLLKVQIDLQERLTLKHFKQCVKVLD